MSAVLSVQSSAFSQRRILLVDDDELIVGPLRQLLVSRECVVAVAQDRATAETYLRSTRFDVVLVDPYLTGLTGQSSGWLLRLARELQPAASIVVLTAYQSARLVQAELDSRADRVLRKPQPISALVDLIIAETTSPRSSLGTSSAIDDPDLSSTASDSIGGSPAESNSRRKS